MLVHEAVADAFVEQLVAKTRAWSYGDPLDPTNDMGTVIDEAAARLFERRVNDAVAAGAQAAASATSATARCTRRPCSTTCSPEMELVREETFGPVSPVIRFRDARRGDRASRTAPRTASSSCGVHQPPRRTSPASSPSSTSARVNVREVPGYRLELTPFGGIKDSGLGYKEGVQEAMKSFTNVKTYSLPW